MKKQIIYIASFLILFVSYGQQTPAPKQTKDFSIEGATAHLGDGTIIENALIMVSEGKIAWIGSAKAKIGRMGEVIEASGKHVYPGFIVANSSLGLGEVDAVKASIDQDEIGSMLPHIKSMIAYNAESRVIESMRPNGVLMGQITPRGGVISGTSSIMQFDAWNWEDAVVKGNDGVHMNWPSTLSYGRWWLGEDPGAKPNKNYSKDVAKIETFFEDAKLYLAGSRTPKNLPYEGMAQLFTHDQSLFVHAEGMKEIADAIAFCKKHQLKMVLVHGNEAMAHADELVENNIPVIIERPHRNPDKEDDDYDYPFKLARMLSEKGVTVAIGMEGQMERMNARNLPFYAGTAAAYGMDKEEALKLITSNPAKILGIDDFAGTLEVGKDATLFISEGDALDMRTNVLTHAFIQGRAISLETHQTELWKRYSNKYKESN